VRDNGLKRKLRSGSFAFGSTVSIPEPFAAEVMGGSGTDFLIIDMEHAAITLDRLQNMLIALHPTPATILVRAPALDPVIIKQILDVGAEAVVVPDISSPEACAQAVRSARYFPDGDRGFGPRRASRLWGTRADYIARANSEVGLYVMIESQRALGRLDAILATPGLDGAIVGPADLAVSMGFLQDQKNPAVDAASVEILDACRRHDVPAGIFASSTTMARQWIDQGGNFAVLGSDLSYIDAGITRTKKDIEALTQRKRITTSS
jgi:2-keto-3-deoxy-L-rhamnonate aldolase RhmA